MCIRDRLATPSTDAGTGARGGELPPSPATQTAASGNTATVRIGTLPGQSQPTQVPAAAIALQMARNLQKGMSRFDIRLDPPEMGRVDVRMEVRKDGHVVAHMSVERPETSTSCSAMPARSSRHSTMPASRPTATA